MLDPSNAALTSMALVVGVAAAALIEVIWWVQGRVLGERRAPCGGHPQCEQLPRCRQIGWGHGIS